MKKKRNRTNFYWIIFTLWISTSFDTWNLCEYLVFWHKCFLVWFLWDICRKKCVWKYLKQFILYSVLNSKCANARISMSSLDQRVSNFFMNNIYLKIFKTIWYKKLYVKICYNSKSLWITRLIFVLKCANTSKPKNILGVENVLIPPICILLSCK